MVVVKTNAHWVLVLMGLPGTGKSTLARHLAERLDASVLHSDRLRTEMGLRGAYDQESRTRVYRELEGRMLQTLQQGRRLILDATFSHDSWRKELHSLLRVHGIHPSWVLCTAPEEVLIERLTRRRDDSEANWKVHQRLRQGFAEPSVPYLEVDTSVGDVHTQAQQILTWIGQSDSGPPSQS